jgi:beta-galactosidase
VIKTAFNDHWAYRPKVSRHAEMMGAASEWTPVTLPHDAMIGTDRTPTAAAATGYFPRSTWEYRTTLADSDHRAGDTLILEFEGVHRDAVVTVNGAVAAQRPYGYSTMYVPIDHLIRTDTENEIVVSAHAGDDSRWYTGAGIYRNVWLHRAGPVYLAPDRVEVRTPEVDDGGSVVTVDAVVRNRTSSSSTVRFRVEIVDASEVVVASDEAAVTMFAGDELMVRRRLFVADPQRWGTDHPFLYTCRIVLGGNDGPIDEHTTQFGIRTLSLDPVRGLRINGEHVDLRGACVHHDNGPLGSATIARADERRVELLKAAGFNAIRSAHNPMSNAMLDACDRVGMIVMDETFDMWHETKSDDDYGLRFAEWWEADVATMVRKDINHPSVVFYSIGNEIADGSTPIGFRIGRALAAKVRSLDDTRFVTQAVSGIMVGGPELIADFRATFAARKVDESTGVNTAAMSLADIMSEMMKSPVIATKVDEAFSHLDAAGYNYMAARFEMDGASYPNRVMYGSETHPIKIGVEWPMVTDNSFVIGDFTWTGWDYLGEAGIGRVEYATDPPENPMSAFQGAYPWLAAWCGDIDITGNRRPQSYYREIVFGLRSDPYIAVVRPERGSQFLAHSSPWSWSDSVSSWSWPGSDGVAVSVEVYADADEVELWINGKSLGVREVSRAQEYRTTFEVSYEPGALEAVARRNGAEIGRYSLTSAEGPVVLDAQVDRPEIRADPFDVAYVEMTLVDAAGSVHTTLDRRVRVEVDGPAVLQGLCSADPAPDEKFTDHECATFDGRALAVIRPTGDGEITVSIVAEGCPPTTVSVRALTPNVAS